MLDSQLFINAIEQLNEDRNIPIETMQEALSEAFIKTYHREFDPEAELRVDIDVKKGHIKMYHIKRVVEKEDEKFDAPTQITLGEAQKINANFKVGDGVESEVELNKEFSTLAALQVKQIIRQKIREKEKELVLNEYSEKIGTMIEGNVEKIKEHFYIIAFDKTFGFLNKNQTPRGTVLGTGDKVKAIIEKIDPNSKGLPIILSMNSVEFIKIILKEEIPEIDQGTIFIDKIARYGGIRTKMIVKSNIDGLDPVGTIVGPGGERIQRVIQKVGREFIDVIPFMEELDKQIARAFVPAKPLFVKIEENKATVVVSSDDFSSAIGRGGSNAKVVSRLLDIEIDVIKEEDANFPVPSDWTYNQTKTSSRPSDVDVDQFKIAEDYEDSDDLFAQNQEQEESIEDNFDFEKINDIPEIDDFEGFAPNPDEDQQEINSDLDDDEDFDKYYE